MNPVSAAVLLAFTIAAGFAPWRRQGWTTPVRALLLEAGAVAAVAGLAWLGGRLVDVTSAGYSWGRLLLLAAAYWYTCAGGAVLIRRVLDLVPVSESSRAEGVIVVPAIELSRGLLIGVLERALALTLVLTDQFGALGLILAAKALARYRAMDDRDFAEYVLIGTLASLLLALLIGLGVRTVMMHPH
ncbi:MAG: hypothetical protein ACREMW_14235 [Gemmatimonadales bacterium]